MDPEGRVLTVYLERAVVVCVYSPNSGAGELKRLGHRIDEFEPALRQHVLRLRSEGHRNVIVAGDLNVAATSLDLHDAKGRDKYAGYTPQERAAFRELLATCELVDTFREKNPEDRRFSYWSNFAQSRQRNKGWRLDYILASSSSLSSSSSTSTIRVLDAGIACDIKGSDHAPVWADLEIAES